MTKTNQYWWVPVLVLVLSGMGYLVKQMLELNQKPATLVGRVINPPGPVDIVIDNGEGGRTKAHRLTGFFRVDEVKPGSHVVEYSVTGYDPFIQEINVAGGRENTLVPVSLRLIGDTIGSRISEFLLSKDTLISSLLQLKIVFLELSVKDVGESPPHGDGELYPKFYINGKLTANTTVPLLIKMKSNSTLHFGDQDFVSTLLVPPIPFVLRIEFWEKDSNIAGRSDDKIGEFLVEVQKKDLFQQIGPIISIAPNGNSSVVFELRNSSQ